MQELSTGSSTVLVMARAFGDQAVQMSVIAHLGTAVELRTVAGNTVYFPAADVYVLDRRLLRRLQDAYEARDELALGRLWMSASPIEMAE